MRYFDSIKKLVLAVFIGMTSVASAQTSHPAAFGYYGGGTTSNWYKDYVGLRFEVVAPLIIAGEKGYTTTNDGDTSHTGNWGGRPRNLINVPVGFAVGSDSNGCAAFPVGFFAGKIALIWRGTCEFGCKAQAAQNAGAVAVVIVNNVAGGPVGMAAGSCGAADTIPIYMISLSDGQAITAQIHDGVPVNMTILTRWNSGFNNDLGFVPDGTSMAHNTVTPMYQMNDASHPDAYKNIEGGYIANFGYHDATGVKIRTQLNYTPTAGGTTTTLRNDSVVASATTGFTTFHTLDSIWAMYCGQYQVPNQTAPGKFDVNYTIFSDSVDQFPGDNTATYSFYTSDSLFSKGRYDFANNVPYSTQYISISGTDPWIMSAPYYIAKGGDAVKNVQFNVSSGPGLLPSGQQFIVYVFKWVDGHVDEAGAAYPHNGYIENGELLMCGAGVRTFDGASDSSFKTYSVQIVDSNGTPGYQVKLDDTSWYLISAQVPAPAGTTATALGCDGVLSGYPRAYGRTHMNNTLEFYNPVWAGDRANSTNNMLAFLGTTQLPYAFDGGSYDVDSVIYSSQKGLIPSLPFTVTKYHPVAVNNVVENATKLELFPNPASNQINVNLGLTSVAKTVSYTIIDGAGRVAGYEAHNNVQNETFSYNTTKLAAGNYTLVVAADSKIMYRKFTIVK